MKHILLQERQMVRLQLFFSFGISLQSPSFPKAVYVDVIFDGGAELLEMHARFEDRNAISLHPVLPALAVHNSPSSCEAEVTSCVTDKGT